VLESLYAAASATDALAAERTFLASERTLLAWLRSAFAMFVTGVTATQVFQASGLVGLGAGLATCSLAVFLTGIVRFRRSNARTLQVLHRARGPRSG
jgi:uncharacterized membrane protein YidH (DUF202 family)